VYLGIVWGKSSDKAISLIYLCNATKRTYAFSREQFAHQGDSDALLELGGGPRTSFTLGSNTYFKVDQITDQGEFDFTTTYTFYRRDTETGELHWALGEINGCSVLCDRRKYARSTIMTERVLRVSLEWLECGPDGEPKVWPR